MSGCDFEKKSFSIYLQTISKNKNAMDWDKVFKKPNASMGITSVKRHNKRGGTNG
jgi:hypothetical protein